MADITLIQGAGVTVAAVGAAVFVVHVTLAINRWLRDVLGYGWDYTATDLHGDASGEGPPPDEWGDTEPAEEVGGNPNPTFEDDDGRTWVVDHNGDWVVKSS
ncbi:hypothetical protein [Roseateles microcysteis]|uniref:hypothetical protein n=1 Tax=Roseateles microcysteis TaxID=3119057 RepID=UPI002FE63B2F